MDFFTIQKPHITEKATSLAPLRKYVFVVDSQATKNEIKKAVHDVYRVDAVAVSIIHRPAKRKKFRSARSYTGAFKKAIVTLKEGQTIDVQ